MTDAYDRALKLATEVGDTTQRFGGPLKRAEKIALAQVWASLAVAEALNPKGERSPLRDIYGDDDATS